MATIVLDDETHALVRFAARLFGVSESEVVARAVRAFSEDHSGSAAPGRDRWTPVDLYADYGGQRIEARFVAATKRLTVTSGATAGTTFTTPSAAARAVVGALNPARAETPVNGWRFWRLAETHERLDVLR